MNSNLCSRFAISTTRRQWRKVDNPINRCIHSTSTSQYDSYDNREYYSRGLKPFQRTWSACRAEWARYARRAEEARTDVYRRQGVLGAVTRDVFWNELIPYDAQFVIIGGGIIGSSIAYWLRQRIRDNDMKVVVIERDDTFGKSATILGLGGIQQQFSVPESVLMSLFTAEFYRHAGEHLRVLDSDPPDIEFLPMSHLYLVNNDESAAKIEQDNNMQLQKGAKVKLLNRDELKLRFPFMNVDDIVIGSCGVENEGVIDPWAALSAIREKNIALGVQYIKAEVTGFLYSYGMIEEDPDVNALTEDQLMRIRRINGVYVTPQLTDAAPRPIRAFIMVNAAGPWAGEVARLAGIGLGPDFMSIPVPIEPRFVFVFHCPDGPGLEMPYLHDPSGVWCRRESIGNTYYCGKDFSEEEDATIDHSNLDVDNSWFHEVIMPILVKRIPSFKSAKLKNSWGAYTDHSVYDQHPVVGFHPVYDNFFQCAGFSGHGVEHSMAIGRAVMEKFLDGAYIDINLRKFDFTRFLKAHLIENNYNLIGQHYKPPIVQEKTKTLLSRI